MKIPFWKMHGAGNDFILADDRENIFPIENTEWISKIASRKTGIGCEGVILIQNSDSSDFRMRFFNPDGSEVEMCGNGARCVARLAYEIGAAPINMTIDTIAGELKAEIQGENVKLHMTEPTDWRINQRLDLNGEKIQYGFVNSGVPHAVITVDNLENCDIIKIGSGIRYHQAFKPEGTNVNFVDISGENSIRIRTYERGVEDETLACGTGMVASALIVAHSGKAKPPVLVYPASGDEITIDFKLTDTGAENVTLFGPTVHVFTGLLDYSE